jgi:anti-sigma B factor antagonist
MSHPSLPARPAGHLLEPAGVRVGIRPGATPVVRICGELDIYSAPELRDELLRVLCRHGPRLSLDLRDVTFLDCAGVNVLLATRRRARLEDGWVRISEASSRAWRTISLLGLQKVFELGASAVREPSA